MSASLPCAPQFAAEAFELRVICLVDITSSSLPISFCQVMHLYFAPSISITLLSPLVRIHMLADDKSLAFVGSLTAVCSLFAAVCSRLFPAVCSRLFPAVCSHVHAVCSLFLGLVPDIGNMKLVLLLLWHIGMTFIIMSNSLVMLVDFSFMEFVFLPKFLLCLSGVVAGSLMSKVTNASMLVQSKGSAIWCIVIFAFIAEFMIDKFALVAISIPGIGSLIVFYNSQGVVSLLSTIGVETRGLLSDFNGLSVVVASTSVMFVSRLALVAAVLLAGLALLFSASNNFLLIESKR